MTMANMAHSLHVSVIRRGVKEASVWPERASCVTHCPGNNRKLFEYKQMVMALGGRPIFVGNAEDQTTTRARNGSDGNSAADGGKWGLAALSTGRRRSNPDLLLFDCAVRVSLHTVCVFGEQVFWSDGIGTGPAACRFIGGSSKLG